MKWFLYFMSIYFVVAGVTFILYPDWLKKSLQKILKDLHIKWFFPLPLIIGYLFIMSRDLLPHPWIAIFIGILAIGKGCYLLFFPERRIENTIHWWTHNVQNDTYRLLGIIVLILGTTILSLL